MIASWHESCDKPRQRVKSKNITLPTEVCMVKAMVFPVVICGCESWTLMKAALKDCCLQTVVLEKTWDSKKIKP